MIPPLLFFFIWFISIIGLSMWIWLILESTYKLTRYHEKERFSLRCLRVGRVYLLLSLLLMFSLITTHNSNNSDVESHIWIFLGAAYVILITARIASNPYEHLVDRGWEFLKDSKEKIYNDVKIKEDYVKGTLKPRVQGILISLVFIIAIYVLIKVLEFATLVDCDNMNFEIDSPALIVAIYVGGAVSATFISEIILAYIFPPLVQE